MAHVPDFHVYPSAVDTDGEKLRHEPRHATVERDGNLYAATVYRGRKAEITHYFPITPSGARLLDSFCRNYAVEMPEEMARLIPPYDPKLVDRWQRIAVEQQIMLEALAAMWAGSYSAPDTFVKARDRARTEIQDAGLTIGDPDPDLLDRLHRAIER